MPDRGLPGVDDRRTVHYPSLLDQGLPCGSGYLASGRPGGISPRGCIEYSSPWFFTDSNLAGSPRARKKVSAMLPVL
jgi:hypothetical protein